MSVTTGLQRSTERLKTAPKESAFQNMEHFWNRQCMKRKERRRTLQNWVFPWSLPVRKVNPFVYNRPPTIPYPTLSFHSPFSSRSLKVAGCISLFVRARSVAGKSENPIWFTLGLCKGSRKRRKKGQISSACAKASVPGSVGGESVSWEFLK